MFAKKSLAAMLCVLLIACCGPRAVTIDDPVAGIPLSRQTTISRARFGFRWPLSVGVGTLACDEHGTILFRTQGVTYVMSGQRTGDPNIAPLRVPAPSGPPSNPLRRITQAQRMDAFAAMLACDSDACRRSTLARFGLSNDDWTTIEVEGRERRWPPLARELMSIEPLLIAGRALCAPGSGR